MDPELMKIVLATMGGGNQETIAEYNPYLQFAAAPQAMAQTIQANIGKSLDSNELWKNAFAASIGGLASGALQGLGQDYQGTLTDRYNETLLGTLAGQPADGSNLPSGLFGDIQRKAKLFKVQQGMSDYIKKKELEAATALEDRKQAGREKLEILKARIKNPWGMPEESPPVESPADTTIGAAKEAPAKALADREETPAAMYRRLLRESGGNDKFAREEVKAKTAARTAEKVEAEDYLIKKRDAVTDSQRKLTDLELAIKGAGQTGTSMVGEETVRSGQLAVRDWLGSDEASQRRAARQGLSSMQLELAGEVRKMFPGQVSDREMALYLKSVMGPDKTPAMNAILFNRLKKATIAGKQRVDLIDKFVSEGASLREATRAVDYTLEKMVPLFVNGEINPDRLNLNIEEIPTSALISGGAGLSIEKKNEQSVIGGSPATQSPKGQGITTKASKGLLANTANTVESAADQYLTGAGSFGESALFGLPTRIAAGIETLKDEAADAIGVGEGKPIGQNYKENLGLWRGALNQAKERNPVAGGVGDVTGAFLSPANKLAVAKKLFAMKGLSGVAGRAGFAGATAAAHAADQGDENVEDRVENAALLSAVMDLGIKGAGKIPAAAQKVYRRTMGVTAADINAASKGSAAIDKINAQGKFDRALKIIDKEQGISTVALAKGDETVMQDILEKAQKTIKTRNSSVDGIISDADRALKGAKIKPSQISLVSSTKMVKDAAGGDQTSLVESVNEAFRGFIKKVGGEKGVTLKQIQDEKKVLNRYFQLDPKIKDAKTSFSLDLRGTIEKSVKSLEDAGKLPQGTLAKLEQLNKDEHDLLTLRTALAKKMPAASAQDPLSTFNAKGWTTGTAGAGGHAVSAGAIGGAESAKWAAITAFMAHSKRIGRPLGKLLSEDQWLNFLKSPELRAAATEVEGVALGSPDDPIDINSTFTGDSSVGFKKKEAPMTEVPMTEAPKVKYTGPKAEIHSAIDEVAASHEIDPKLLKALAMQESALNPKAVSDAGAIGLTQLMPGTARDIARKLGLSKYDLRDPKTNLIFGATYLKGLIEKYDGDLKLALSAYHSGDGRVDRILASSKSKDSDAIISKLGPIGRRYAKSVLQKMEA
jgi:soluble lytic murein transglycosylase-like protein